MRSKLLLTLVAAAALAAPAAALADHGGGGGGPDRRTRARRHAVGIRRGSRPDQRLDHDSRHQGERGRPRVRRADAHVPGRVDDEGRVAGRHDRRRLAGQDPGQGAARAATPPVSGARGPKEIEAEGGGPAPGAPKPVRSKLEGTLSGCSTGCRRDATAAITILVAQATAAGQPFVGQTLTFAGLGGDGDRGRGRHDRGRRPGRGSRSRARPGSTRRPPGAHAEGDRGRGRRRRRLEQLGGTVPEGLSPLLP